MKEQLNTLQTTKINPIVKFFINNGAKEMNVKGDLKNPQKFIIKPKEKNEILYITGITLDAHSYYYPNLGNFCGLDALPNGLTLQVNVDAKNIIFTNWKTLSDMRYDADLEDFKLCGKNLYATKALISLGGFIPVIKLDGANGDSLEVWVQDDLTGLKSFSMRVKCHEEIISKKKESYSNWLNR